MDQEKIGRLISEKRREIGLTQRDLADKLNVTDKAVSRWERGVGLPDVSYMLELSKILNISVNELLGEEIKYEESNKRKKLKIFLIFFSSLLILLLILLVVKHYHSDYIFNSINSDSEFFSINGVITSYKERQSIYINDIKYLKEDKDYLYLECNLIERLNGTEQMISSYVTDKEVKKFNDLLSKVEFKVGDYNSLCRNLENYFVYIKINAYLEDGVLENYEIPLKLVDDCS